MLFRRVTLFRFFGFPVRADASWIFLSVLIAWTLSRNVYPALYPGYGKDLYHIMAVATLGGLIVSILVHEVAHAVIAEYYDMPISGITLFVFGGVAEMEGEPSHPKGELLMALAGPAMSVLAGLLFHAAAEVHGMYLRDSPVTVVLGYLGTLNFYIAAFNMIPAFPLDGGRALRAIIWQGKNNFVLATRACSVTGFAFAYVLLGWGCYKITFDDSIVAAIWAMVLGLFTHGAAAYAVRQAEHRSVLATEPVSRFVQEGAHSVPPGITLADFVDQHVHRHYQKSFPVTDRGRLVGVISLETVMGIDRGKWPWLHISSVMESPGEGVTISPRESAARAFDIMQKHRRDFLVVAQEGEMHGIVAFRDIASYLAITMEVDGDRPVRLGKRAY